MPLLLKAFRPNGQIDESAIAQAAELLKAGRLVALPTETVYGLGANALDVAAVRSIFAAKGRPTFNPLIVHVTSSSEAKQYVTQWPDIAERLAAQFWPGPLSLVLPKSPLIADDVTGGHGAVALRSPAHPVARAVLQAAGIPIAAPSANRSNAISPTTAQHVIASLGDRIDAVLDGGPCAVGIESTVIDLTSTPRILRPGGVSAEQLEAIIGPVARGAEAVDSGTRASPGMLTRHYAPDAETRLVPESGVAAALRTLPESARVGVLLRTGARVTDPRIVAWEALGEDASRFAQDVYAALHRIEAAGATHVFIEELPATSAWVAVADRLKRAAGVRQVEDAS